MKVYSNSTELIRDFQAAVEELTTLRAELDAVKSALEHTLELIDDNEIQPECEFLGGRAYCQHAHEVYPCPLCKARLLMYAQEATP